jgi:hypothetical protein
MPKKSFELTNKNSCLNKARSDEPVFVLLARDPVAAQIIRLWCAAALDFHGSEKIDDANFEANKFEEWHMQNIPQMAANAASPSLVERVNQQHKSNTLGMAGTQDKRY